MLDAGSWNGAAPFALILMALAADGLLGGLPGIAGTFGAPMAFMRGLTRWFDDKLNRRQRGTGARRIRGLLVVIVVVVIGWAFGAALAYYARRLSHGWIVEVLVLAMLLGQHRAIARARRAAGAIAAGTIADARSAVAPLVRYDTANLDEFGAARAAIEGSAVRFTEGCIGSVFWYLLLGLPGLCVYRAVCAAADVIGRPSPRHGAFGFTAARLGDVLTLPAAIAAGPVIVCAAVFVPRARPRRSFAGWARDLAGRGIRGAFRSEGALAGALEVALGGPRPFDGQTQPGAWIGDGRARATVADVRRAVLLITVACLLVALLVALALVVPAR